MNVSTADDKEVNNFSELFKLTNCFSIFSLVRLGLVLFLRKKIADVRNTTREEEVSR